MSNIHKQRELTQRKIKIKPLEIAKKEYTKEEAENETVYIQMQLEKVKKELAQMEENKQQLLSETALTIETEKEQWIKEKEQWIAEAKEEGYQVGYEQGKNESLHTYQSFLEQANKIVELVKIDYQKTLEKTEDVIIQLGIHTAEKILKQKIEENPDLFLNIVRLALKEIKDQSIVSIYLHPVNYEEVLLQKPELKTILENNTKLSLYVNDDLPENSCVIEHPFGQIEAGVDTQLKKIREALNEYILELEQ